MYIINKFCVGKVRAEGPGGRTDRAEGRTDRAEGPGGRTGRTDRAEGPGGRTGRTDRAEGPGGRTGQQGLACYGAIENLIAIRFD